MSTDNELKQKIEKLPVWAQHYITQLKMRSQKRKEELDALRSNKPTNISYGWYSVIGGERPIPDDCGPINFKCGDILFRVNIFKSESDSAEGPYLQVVLENGAISVEPSSSNVIRIRGGKW